MSTTISLNIHYFASVREALGLEAESLQLPTAVASVAELKAYLAEQRGEAWRRVLLEGRVLAAVNHSMVPAAHPLRDGDELAFFPPVTGG